MTQIMPKFHLAFGGAGLLQGLVSTPTRRGPTFVCAKVGKTHLGLRPKTPLPLSCGWIRIELFSIC